MSDNPEFTPGPWHWVNHQTDEPRQPGEYRADLRTVEHFGEDKTEIIDGKSYTSFSLPKWILRVDEIGDENMEANAALIAAAPDLYAALVETLEIANRNEDGPWAERARAALSNANQKAGE